MALLNFNFFGRKKQTLSSVASDELRRERIKLDSEQRKLDTEIDRLGRDESQLKSEFAVATTDAQKRAIARKIDALRTRLKTIEVQSAHCHKCLKFVNNLVMVKDQEAFLKRVGQGIIFEMDMAELQENIDDVMVRLTMETEKMEMAGQQLDDAITRMADSGSTDTVADLMAELESDPEIQRQRQAGPANVTTTSPVAQNQIDQSLESMRAAARELQREGQS